MGAQTKLRNSDGLRVPLVVALLMLTCGVASAAVGQSTAALGGRRALAADGPASSPASPPAPTGAVVIDVQNSTRATADFLGALQSGSETVRVAASSSAGLYAECVCETSISGLQAQLLLAIGSVGGSLSQGNGTAGETRGQIDVSQLSSGQFLATTSSAASARATGQSDASIDLGLGSATSAVRNSSALAGAGTETRGAATAGDDGKAATFAAGDSVRSGGASLTSQTTTANVTSFGQPADALSTPFRTVVVSTHVSIRYVASGVVTPGFAGVAVHTEVTASSALDLIFPDPATPGRVYVTRISGEAASTCDCVSNSTFPNGGSVTSAPLAQANGADEKTESAAFATDALTCNVYVLLEGRVELHLLLWACPSQPGDVATCADVTLPSGSASPTPTTAQGSTATASPVSSPGGGATCPDPLKPNPCYNAGGSIHTCCPGACTGTPGDTPTCEGVAGGNGPSGPSDVTPKPTGSNPSDAPTPTGSDPSPPVSTGPSLCPNPALPNPCYNAGGDAHTCCSSACGSPPRDTPYCSGDPPSGRTSEPTATSSPTSEPTSEPTSGVPSPTTGAQPVTCPDPGLPNPCYNAGGDAHTCCSSACGSPPKDTPYCSGDPSDGRTSEPTATSSTTSEPTSEPTSGGSGAPSPTTGAQPATCPDPALPNPCYNANGDARTCCAGACGSPPTLTPFCAGSGTGNPNPTLTPTPTPAPTPTPTPAPNPTPTPTPNPNPNPTPTGETASPTVTPTPSPVPSGTESSVPSPTPTASQNEQPGSGSTPGPVPTGCPTGGPNPGGGATACGQISQNSTTTDNGCTSAVVSLTAKAQSTTVALYSNTLDPILESASAAFCARPSSAQLAVSAGMLAEVLANATAAAMIDATSTVCACGNTPSFSAASVGAYVSAVASAIADAAAQAIVDIFGSGDCENAALLAQASGFAQSTASAVGAATNTYFAVLTTAGQGPACQSNAVGATNRLVQLYAQAYACAIVTVFSSAYNDADPYIMAGQTATDQAGQCSNDVTVGFTNAVNFGPPASCATACQCQFGLTFAPNPVDGGQTQSCQCPNGTVFKPEKPGCV